MLLSAQQKIEFAARNNAVWCDSVCRAHGVPGEFHSAGWLDRHAPPPYHSNLVVVSATATQSAVVEHVHDLMTLPLSPGWSVKDSFFKLDLADEGFGVLFEASWIWAEPAARRAPGRPAGLRWSRVASAPDLARWNTAASGGPAQFPASLLADPQIAFFAKARGQEIVAGGIANRTGDVVGVSNVFVHDGDEAAAWVGLVDGARGAFPGLPWSATSADRAWTWRAPAVARPSARCGSGSTGADTCAGAPLPGRLRLLAPPAWPAWRNALPHGLASPTAS